MSFAPDELEALQSDAIRLGLFLRLDLSPPLRCWFGCGRIDPGVTLLDPSGAEYFGFGQLLNVPTMSQLINAQAERVDISLSGTDDRILGLASFANKVNGVACDFGFGLFGTSWQLLGPVHWVRHYVADYLRMAVTPAGTPADQIIKTATLSVSSAMTGRRRPRLSFLNQQDQAARSLQLNPTLPVDRFCERTKDYTLAGVKTWPIFA